MQRAWPRPGQIQLVERIFRDCDDDNGTLGSAGTPQFELLVECDELVTPAAESRRPRRATVRRCAAPRDRAIRRTGKEGPSRGADARTRSMDATLRSAPMLGPRGVRTRGAPPCALVGLVLVVVLALSLATRSCHRSRNQRAPGRTSTSRTDHASTRTVRDASICLVSARVVRQIDALYNTGPDSLAWRERRSDPVRRRHRAVPTTPTLSTGPRASRARGLQWRCPARGAFGSTHARHPGTTSGCCAKRARFTGDPGLSPRRNDDPECSSSRGST